jgi:hypothetical protein
MATSLNSRRGIVLPVDSEGSVGLFGRVRTSMENGCIRRSGRVSLRIPFRLRAFRRRSESLQPLVGFTCELSQLRVYVISVTGRNKYPMVGSL